MESDLFFPIANRLSELAKTESCVNEASVASSSLLYSHKLVTLMKWGSDIVLTVLIK